MIWVLLLEEFDDASGAIRALIYRQHRWHLTGIPGESSYIWAVGTDILHVNNPWLDDPSKPKDIDNQPENAAKCEKRDGLCKITIMKNIDVRLE
jgi:hypothetical protein